MRFALGSAKLSGGGEASAGLMDVYLAESETMTWWMSPYADVKGYVKKNVRIQGSVLCARPLHPCGEAGDADSVSYSACRMISKSSKQIVVKITS
jgi:hypothetical protein